MASCLVFDPAGALLCSCRYDGYISLWMTRTYWIATNVRRMFWKVSQVRLFLNHWNHLDIEYAQLSK